MEPLKHGILSFMLSFWPSIDAFWTCQRIQWCMGCFQAKCIITLTNIWLLCCSVTPTASEEETGRESNWISYLWLLFFCSREGRAGTCLAEMGSKCWVPPVVSDFLLLAFKKCRRRTWRFLWAELQLKNNKYNPSPNLLAVTCTVPHWWCFSIKSHF